MFQLKTNYAPCGDQPTAIAKLVKGLRDKKRSQTLLGITGSGKTFTMANIIQEVQRPSLILAHNKTLAGQLYQEFKSFFPNNAVEYFVSYYDYYQPEAYIARTDTYIEKDLAINDQIDRMRLSATRSLLERRDVIIVASVSCIYGLGTPENFASMRLMLKVGQMVRRDDILLHLVTMNYVRNEFELLRSKFRVRGDVLEIVPSYEENRAYRIEFFGDEVERISVIDPLTGRVYERVPSMTLYPGSHYVTPEEIRMQAVESIRDELAARLKYYQSEGKFVEEHRIGQRTRYDLEMIKEIGFCKGIENYSRHFSGRMPGEAPSCLLEYFPDDYLLFIDESHQTVPQIRAMYNGDHSRKNALVEFGFRLPSAYDNRPLKFEEFYERIHQVIYVSATPAPFELAESEGEIVEQIIRPTGLLDPKIEVRKATYQVDDCIAEIQKECAKGQRVLVTTLTKKLSEDLSKYLQEVGVKAKYLHSDIDTLERMQIIKDLRLGLFDVLVGINLLREGLDIPEVSLVVILDADKEGFLRSETALIQTSGRAARNEEGRVILYADKITKSIERTIAITEARRALQEEHNKKHGIIPKTVHRDRVQSLSDTFFGEEKEEKKKSETHLTPEEIKAKIEELEKAMKAAAKDLRFEDAASLRDRLHKYQQMELFEDHPL